MATVTKTCTKCGAILPSTTAFFYQRAAAVDGLRAQCKKCAAKYDVAWRKTNRAKIKATSAAWYKANREKASAAHARWRHKTPHLHIARNISSEICRSLHGRKDGRRWESLTGYTCPELRKHLEAQFRPGMTWGNYGKRWHIDHVRPIASFSFTNSDDSDFKECWALHNLRPLWIWQNMRKGAKWDGQPLLVFGKE